MTRGTAARDEARASVIDRDRREEGTAQRRRFLRACGCAIAGVAIASISPMLAGCEFTNVIEVDEQPDTGTGKTVEIDVSSLTADGTGLIADVRGPDRKKIFVARLEGGSFKAMSTECTHSQFPLAYDAAGRMLYCTGGQGHDSKFNLQGEPLSGPAVPFGPVRVYPSVFEAARSVLVVTIG